MLFLVNRMFFCFFLIGITAAGDREPVVSTVEGNVQGTMLSSKSGRIIYSFRGIPYAEPPIGELRFQHPRVKQPWKETLKADRSVQCLQESLLRQKLMGDEDCLVLNVYSNNLKSNSNNNDNNNDDDDNNNNNNNNNPVMVFIHGGGFVAGDGTTSFYGPQYLLDQDIVLVTINYRLGALGFLTLGDDVLPANLGLWDQKLALQWVQRNIAAFGGDPNRVTLFGESAGAMSTMIHLMSPQSQGLFHGAIAQSGVASTSFMSSDKHPAYYARTLAGRLGCNPEGTSMEIRKCMQKVDAMKLTEESYLFRKYGLLPVYFKPVVDGFSSSPYLPKDPADLLEEGNFNKVPIMMGCNSEEGTLLTARFVKEQAELEELNANWEENLAFLLFQRDADEVSDLERSISREMLEKDFKGKKPTADSGLLDTLSQLYGDAVFFAPAAITASKLALKNGQQPVYHYLFTHRGSTSLADFALLPRWKIALRILGRLVGLNIFGSSVGPTHADELLMLFGNELLPYEVVYSDEDILTSNNMVKMWTNFAKNKDPNPVSGDKGGLTWERVEPGNLKTLRIGAELTFGPFSPVEKARVKRWEDYWANVPQRMHLERSKTWSNPELYDVERAKKKINKNEL